MGNNEPNYKENLIFLKENIKNKKQNIDELLEDIEILYDELLKNCPEKEQWLIKNFPYVKNLSK